MKNPRRGAALPRATRTLLALTAIAAAASAQTVTVTTSRDVVDVPFGATLADLPGPDGLVSFREALRATDNTPGHQTIGFAIPQSDWYLASIFPGRCLLQGSFSWSAADSVTVDGTTQTDFTGDTFPGGNELVVYGLALYLNGDGSVVTGLHDSRVELNGSGCDVYGNTGSMNLFLYFGSGSQVHDNEAGTITLNYTSDVAVVRNTTQRVRVIGNPFGQFAVDNRIGGPDPADRNFITGWGNYGEHGVPAGTTVQLLGTRGTLIQNNYIGTTPDGMAIGNPASTVGIGIQDTNGDVSIRDNLIATRAVGVGPATGVVYGLGIFVEGDGAVVEITGNTVGLDAAGQPVLGGVNGVQVGPYNYDGISDVRVGGQAPGEGNVIAGHLSTGVLVGGVPGLGPRDVRISGNAIHSNGDLAVDLTPNSWTFGPTANDPLDADVGANGLQNHPDLLLAAVVGPTLRVVGGLHSEPLSAYTIELFASPDCDPNGRGQAHVFLGSLGVVTDSSGNASFNAMVPALAPPGWFVSSTATHEPIGATSELSACVPVGLTRLGASSGARYEP